MISYNYTNKIITVDATTSLRAVYSDAMETFAESSQMDDLIPLRGDTPTLFTLLNGWVFSDESIPFLTSAALQDATLDNIWTNVQTLGTISSGTYIYIEQNGAIVWESTNAGHINMLLKTKDDGTVIDDSEFVVYARKFQQEYASFSTVGGSVVANCPLSTKVDTNLDISEGTLQAYEGLSITWGAITRDALDGQGSQPYSILIDGAGKSLKEIYNWIQYQLLADTDIDAGAGTHIGKITSPLLAMAGSTVITKQGVWLEDFRAADANFIRYTDDNNVMHTPPQYITISVDAPIGMAGGRVAVYRLDEAYDPATYTPANIVDTIIDAVLDSNGNSSLAIEYEGDWEVRVVTRKAGYKPFDVGTVISTNGLSVTTVNEEDIIYQA
jgi:hypothetical protein